MKELIESWRNYMFEDKRSDSEKITKAVIYDEDKKVLILKRAGNMKKHPNEWDLPGGHAIEGEDLEDAVTREVWEETGLMIKEPSKLYSQGRNTYYKASLPSKNDVRLSDEHTNYKMISIEQAKDYELPEKYLNAIKRGLK